MEDTIQIRGRDYLSVKDAALVAQLTRDYIARLCRLGKLEAHRIGKNWYILETSLRAFIRTEENGRAERRERLAAEYVRSRDAIVLPQIPIDAVAEPPALTPPIENVQSKFREAFGKIAQTQSLPQAASMNAVPGSASAAVLSLCLIFAAWTFGAPPQARVLATSFLINTGARVHAVLQSDPQQTAYELRTNVERLSGPIQNAAVAFGQTELSSVAQVGNVFTGYSDPPVSSNKKDPVPTVIATLETSVGGGAQTPIAQIVIGTSTTSTYTITVAVAGQASSTVTITASSTSAASTTSARKENPPLPRD